MTRFKQFIINTIIGGVFVMLPIVVIVVLFNWVFNLSMTYLKPIAQFITNNAPMHVWLAYVLALVSIFTLCFFVGFVVRTAIGKILYHAIEKNILSKIPGYNLIKETLAQLLGAKQSPFSAVALVTIFGNDTMVTAFITNRHKSGIVTVFVPTGPNPTSGNIYHLEDKYVHQIDVPVEDVMRAIIGCGTGSDTMIDDYIKKLKPGTSGKNVTKTKKKVTG